MQCYECNPKFIKVFNSTYNVGSLGKFRVSDVNIA